MEVQEGAQGLAEADRCRLPAAACVLLAISTTAVSVPATTVSFTAIPITTASVSFTASFVAVPTATVPVAAVALPSAADDLRPLRLLSVSRPTESCEWRWL